MVLYVYVTCHAPQIATMDEIHT